jgi:Ca-activated chloride channel family protein
MPGPNPQSPTFFMTRLLTTACLLAITASQAAPARLAAARQEGGQVKPNFSSESQLVVLHVAVRDRRGGYVGGLGQEMFKVSEDRQPQSISFFSSQDAPVTVGLLIDSSGSMGPNREKVIAASLAFARSMNQEDEIFVLGFNESIHTPLPAAAPFTRDLPTLFRALAAAITARGQTAIYNAINAGLDYVTKGTFERQVLVVVSDGGDNASSTTRSQVLASAQASNAVIYTVALVDSLDPEADPGFLRQLSEATGGVAFRPKNVGEVQAVLQRVASDIRNMYTLGYVPTSIRPAKREELRRVAVDVKLPTGQKLAVRTRRAYLAGAETGSGDAR